jgi:hypothetical protein
MYAKWQVVVVSSGTNDWHSMPPLYSLEDWVTQGIGFLKEVTHSISMQLSPHQELDIPSIVWLAPWIRLSTVFVQARLPFLFLRDARQCRAGEVSTRLSHVFKVDQA